MSKDFKIDWVLKNKIAIGPAPQLLKDIELLKEIGIKSILTLCEIENCYPNISEFFVHRVFTLPDHKIGKAPTKKELDYCLNILDELREYRPTLVHCFASVERSPLVCIAFLIKEKGISQQLALEYLMQVHPGTNPLPEQLEILNKIN